jgi:hypothetical protein
MAARALAIAPDGNIFVGATYVDTYQNPQTAIYEFDPSGNKLGSQAYTSGYAGGVSLLGLFADAGNNLHIALAFPYANNKTFLDIKTVNGSFAQSGEITDTNIQPLAGFFQPDGSFYVTGNQAASSPTGGTRAEAFDAAGAQQWSSNFNNGSNLSSHWSYSPALFPSPTPGESVLGLEKTLVPTAGATQLSFVTEYLNATGSAVWTTPQNTGQLGNLAVDSESQVYLSYSTLSNSVTSYHLQGITGGSPKFTVAISGQATVGVDGMGSVFVATSSSQYGGQVVLQRLSSTGSLTYHAELTANMPGGTTAPVTEAFSFTQAAPGTLLLMGEAGSPADVYVSQISENPSLTKVTWPGVKCTKSFTGSVTLDAPAPVGGYVVNLTSTSDITLNQTSVTVLAGQTTATFTGQGVILDLTAPGQVTGFGQDGSVKTGLSKVVAAQIIGADNDGDNVIITGGDPWGVTLIFSVPTGPDGMTVTMTSSSPSVIADAMYHIPGGVTSFHVGGTSSTVGAPTDADLDFTDPNGGGAGAPFSVTPPLPGRN